MFPDRLVSGREIENCEPVGAEGVTSWVIVGGWQVDGEVGAGVSSGDAGLEGILGERKATTESVGRSKPEGLSVWKSSSGSERTERQSSQGGKIRFNAARKKD